MEATGRKKRVNLEKTMQKRKYFGCKGFCYDLRLSLGCNLGKDLRKE